VDAPQGLAIVAARLAVFWDFGLLSHWYLGCVENSKQQVLAAALTSLMVRRKASNLLHPNSLQLGVPIWPQSRERASLPFPDR
jgi:hypothetical protein